MLRGICVAKSAFDSIFTDVGFFGKLISHKEERRQFSTSSVMVQKDNLLVPSLLEFFWPWWSEPKLQCGQEKDCPTTIARSQDANQFPTWHIKRRQEFASSYNLQKQSINIRAAFASKELITILLCHLFLDPELPSFCMIWITTLLSTQFVGFSTDVCNVSTHSSSAPIRKICTSLKRAQPMGL